jgi:hypothetical protein
MMVFFPKRLVAVFLILWAVVLASGHASGTPNLETPSLPWTPEEIEEKLSANWPMETETPNTPGFARLRVTNLKDWQKEFLQGSESALLDTFGRFENKVNEFSSTLENHRNHKDPSQRLSSEQYNELKMRYDEAYSIINGKGGYLRIYKKWNKQYRDELQKWQARL